MSVQDELRKTDYTWDHDDDLMKESARHKVYMDTIDTLREQLPTLREKIKNAKICGAGESSGFSLFVLLLGLIKISYNIF